MTFRPRNAYYLRISANVVLPLFLYLDERHIDWMSDVVLQHVLADLRPLIFPKLQAEKDVHFGPGATPGNKRGIVEVHRGETYQFAYFFRKTEPHTVLFKSRYFVTAPLPSEIAPNTTPVELADRNPQRKGPKTRAPSTQTKRKRTKSQCSRRDKNLQGHLDEDEWIAEESEDGVGDADPTPRKSHPVRKQRRIITGAYLEPDDDDAEDMCQDVTMHSPLEMDGVSTESSHVSTIKDGDVVASDANDRPSDTADIELAVEEEEDKPKPLLKLKYQSFQISGHCLCVVVEPWPPLRTETRSPMALRAPLRRGGLELSLDGAVLAGRRAETPLFLPEFDRAPSEVPFARERSLPPARTEDEDHNDDDLMNFSQALNAAGHMHAITADDDDDMDGAVLFGDADEVRELL